MKYLGPVTVAFVMWVLTMKVGPWLSPETPPEMWAAFLGLFGYVEALKSRLEVEELRRELGRKS